MHIKNIKSNIVLVGAGYWGTNITKNLIKLEVKKIIICDKNYSNCKILKRRIPLTTVSMCCICFLSCTTSRARGGTFISTDVVVSA